MGATAFRRGPEAINEAAGVAGAERFAPAPSGETLLDHALAYAALLRWPGCPSPIRVGTGRAHARKESDMQDEHVTHEAKASAHNCPISRDASTEGTAMRVDELTNQIRDLTSDITMPATAVEALEDIVGELRERTGAPEDLEPILLAPWQQRIWLMFGHNGQEGWEALSPAAQHAWLEFGPCR
jgi:hypothetical protein